MTILRAAERLREQLTQEQKISHSFLELYAFAFDDAGVSTAWDSLGATAIIGRGFVRLCDARLSSLRNLFLEERSRQAEWDQELREAQ